MVDCEYQEIGVAIVTDGYNTVRYGLPKNNPIVFVRCYNIRTQAKGNKGTDEFKRRMYYKENSSLKVVQYEEDELAYTPQPYCNDNCENPREYLRTMPSIIADIRERGTAKNQIKWLSANESKLYIKESLIMDMQSK